MRERSGDRRRRSKRTFVKSFVNLSGKKAVSGHDSEKPAMAPKEQLPSRDDPPADMCGHTGMNLSGCETEEDDRLFCHLPFSVKT